MANPVDPNRVLMTGENSFVRLSPDGGKTMSDRFSHWRVLWCPDGAGHVLFAQSTLTGGDVRVYADNIAVARWLQKTIETLLHPPFADTKLPVITAEFARGGTFFPARGAQAEMNGKFATGQPWAEMRGDRQASSCTLAWSETWVTPRA
jgi:hypothetical protein